MNVKKLLVTLMALAMIFTTSSAFAKGSKQQTKQYSGEELYRGIVFGQGKVAVLFPEIWTKDLLKETNKKETKEVVDQLISQMKASNPKYFTEFQKAVYSGDHLKVKSALAKGGTLLSKEVQAQNAGIAGAEGVGHPSCALYVAYAAAVVSAAAAVSHAVVVTAAGGAVAYLYVVTGKYFWTSSKDSATSKLQQEKVINLVATEFAH